MLGVRDKQSKGRGAFGSQGATALESRLNEARRARHGRILQRERQVFLERLALERQERVVLEAWAVSRIQAIMRGYLARPRPPRLRPRKLLTPAEANRELVAELQAILSGAGLPTIPGMGLGGEKFRGRDGSKVGRSHVGKGQGRARPRSRKRRGLEHEMARRITTAALGFLGRREAGLRRAERDTQRLRSAVGRIELAWVLYRRRVEWRDFELGIMNGAAVRIQARWRGLACRMALAIEKRRRALFRRQTVSAITIQAAVRRRLAMSRYRTDLSLLRGARRTTTEAHVRRPERAETRVER